MDIKTKEFLIAIFLGWLGGYRFYKRQYILGIIYFLTFGLFGIGWLVDIVCTLQSDSSCATKTNINNKTIFVNDKSNGIQNVPLKKPVYLNTYLTSTLYARNILEQLDRWDELGYEYEFDIELPTGKQKSCRVFIYYKNEKQLLGNFPADFSKRLLVEYPNCKYSINSYCVTYAPNGGVGCDVVVKVTR